MSDIVTGAPTANSRFSCPIRRSARGTANGESSISDLQLRASSSARQAVALTVAHATIFLIDHHVPLDHRKVYPQRVAQGVHHRLRASRSRSRLS